MILSCSNITKSFGDKHILKQVSFHLEDHEKAAIVGINGAGKTTLLKIIIGEEPLEAFDTFVEEWNAEGGADITAEVQELANQ